MNWIKAFGRQAIFWLIGKPWFWLILLAIFSLGWWVA